MRQRQHNHSVHRFRYVHILLIFCVLIAGAPLAIGISKYFNTGSVDVRISQDRPLCKDCNIVLITLDVCSAKHLPCYGYGRNTTPNLCAFAEKNQLFLNSFANATYTLPSHVSLFTGLLPLHHGVIELWKGTLDKSIPLLTEVLQKNGYKTILLQEDNSAVIPMSIYSRGANKVQGVYDVSDIMKHIDQYAEQGEKTFVSYYNAFCHEPNRVGSKDKLFTKDSYPQIPIEPEGDFISFTPEFFTYLREKLPIQLEENRFREHTSQVKDLFNRMMKSETYAQAKALFLDPQALKDNSIKENLYWAYIYETYIDVKNKRQMEYLRALYDQQLVELDHGVIGKFLVELQSSKQRDNTIVLITSQHGQEFGEHGVFGHTTLYDGNLRVPFVLSVPGLSSKKYLEPVQNVDVMPTLLELVGVKHDTIFDGLSLVNLLKGSTVPERFIISSYINNDKISIQNVRWKLLVSITDGEVTPYELYDMINDPYESKNVLFSHIDIASDIIKEYNKRYFDNR